MFHYSLLYWKSKERTMYSYFHILMHLFTLSPMLVIKAAELHIAGQADSLVTIFHFHKLPQVMMPILSKPNLLLQWRCIVGIILLFCPLADQLVHSYSSSQMRCILNLGWVIFFLISCASTSTDHSHIKNVERKPCSTSWLTSGWSDSSVWSVGPITTVGN